ncbi:MAG: SusC/RagA family TonB-linked outer membrane protein [Sphingobacteriales bacterium 50-39]|nr:TonB-dependent receptor [Sphingobacteriales bacterium]OJW56043.1 MAG: SusC/RagA family TonB-linked outer membrane protein [Sphingobacteriales bacterium 50-39]
MNCLRYSFSLLILLLLLAPCLSQAQTGKVSGKILSGGDGGPMEGVTVRVKGRANAATVTNAAGQFTIFSGARDTLLFSYTGYESAVIALDGRDNVEVTLTPSGGKLQNVVVIGYGTVKKKDLTGSVASVDTKELSSLPVANIGDAVEGRASGVQVISSGAPGSNVTFRIRGTGTINNADPLIVVDGVPTDAPLNNLDPNDIASFDVLKDASAAAIYGSRGANGVILVSTKKGANGKGHLSFNYYSAWQRAAKVVKMLNASQFAALNNEMLTAGNQTVNPAFAHPDSLGEGTDWLGALFRTAPMRHFSLSYSGGSDKYNYYVSGGVLDQQGIVTQTSYKRYTVQFNSQARPLNWISFGNNLTLTVDDKPSGSYDIRSTMASNPVQPLYNKDGTWSNVLGNPLWYGDITNQIGTAHVNQNETKGYNVLGSAYAELALFRGLKFKTTGGIQAQFFDSRSWAPVYNFQPNPQTSAYLFQQYNKNLTYLWDNYFTYDRNFGADHHLTVLAGSSAQNNRYDFLNGNKTGFPSDVTQQMSSGTGVTNTGGNASEWSLLSFMGRVNYTYQDKYLVTATLRRDGSSRFGGNNKYGTFPSASLAWRISKEDFFQGLPFINDLKLRAGYGVTGNQNIGNYSFASALQIAQYNFNGHPVSIVYPLVLPNPNVQWEQVSQGNIGIDASLLDSRVNVTVDAYVKNTSKMLVPAIVPVTTGYSSTVVPSVNAASMQNKGIEVTVSTKNMTGPFTWSTDLNISFNQNIIKSLNDSTPLYVDNYGLNAYFGIDQVGHPANEFYGYVMNGIFQSQKEVDNHALQQAGTTAANSTSPGDIRFADLNSDGVINEKDRTYIGDPNPRFIYSMGNSFSYKGFDLNIYLQGVYGNKIFNANNINQESMSIAQNQTTRTLQRWEGPGTSSYMPRAIYGDPNQNTRVSNRYIEDGSYLRVKNITLGYTFSPSLTRRAGISSLRLYGSCQNVYTFTHYSGFDPEVGVNGVDYSVYPVTRTISVGININL